MRRKRPRPATLEEVVIIREQDGAMVEYSDPTIHTHHFTIGSAVAAMTDEQILDRWNALLRANAALGLDTHTAIEVPPGAPQLERSPRGTRWSMRGDVLRCVIESDGAGAPQVRIDDHVLTWADLGQLLLAHEGWGVRLTIVPDDRLDAPPAIEVRDLPPRRPT